MANKKENSRDTEYQYREDNQPHQQTGNVNERNNNIRADAPTANEPNVENANNIGIGDAGINDDTLTKHTQNHSSDA